MLPLMMVMIMATMMMMTVVLLVVLMPVMLMLVMIMTVIMKEDGKHEEEKSKNHYNNKAEQGQPNSGPQRKGKKKGHQLHICERREESTQIEVIYRTRKKKRRVGNKT